MHDSSSSSTQGCAQLLRCVSYAADVSHTLVFYVPPHDLLTVLNSAATILGANRQCVIARELTKVCHAPAEPCMFWHLVEHVVHNVLWLQVHEEFFRSTIADAVEHFGSTAAKVMFITSHLYSS